MINKSILNTDLYKLTMQQAVFEHFPTVEVEYKFLCRNKNVDLYSIKDDIIKNIKEYFDSAILTKEEYNYLTCIGLFKKGYLDYLKNFKFSLKNITISNIDDKFDLRIKGTWLKTILYEVPLLSIISETYYSKFNTTGLMYEAKNKLDEKMKLFHSGLSSTVSEFGTRRRLSDEFHEYFIQKTNDKIIRTSNVYYAMKYGLNPVGTMAHEWFQGMQGIFHPRDCHTKALDYWLKTYNGKLGIALTDIIGIDEFLKDFNLFYSKIYDGVRHDSGCPYKFGEKMISHYKSMGIDPKTKTIVFSDGLNFEKANNIYEKFNNRIKVSFGIGTYLTNDSYIDPLQLVIKMVKCQNRDTIKLSDSSGKTMCENKAYKDYIKDLFGRK